jgi:ABC-type multidrug transport system ATPase subunit
MIEFSDVSRTYGMRTGRRVDALTGVTLSIGSGESVAVVGPNGAGKSTLLALVLGFLRPSRGDIMVEDRGPREWVMGNGAGWLPERFEPPREWTAGGTLRALAGLEGRAAGARSKVDATLDRFGLTRHASKPVSALSRGLVQRLGLAQAVIAARSLVILDEPTNGLDPDGRALFRDTVGELRANGTTLLIASHDLAELERTTSRAIVLEGGRVREIIDVAQRSDAGVFTIAVRAPAPVVLSAFPDAKQTVGAGEDLSRWSVTVEGPKDLNRRLAALIAAGGLLREVVPATASLEERMRRTDEQGSGDT